MFGWKSCVSITVIVMLPASVSVGAADGRADVTSGDPGVVVGGVAGAEGSVPVAGAAIASGAGGTGLPPNELQQPDSADAHAIADTNPRTFERTTATSLRARLYAAAGADLP